MDDVTDAYIIATFLDIFDMDTMKSKSPQFPLFSLMSDSEKAKWLSQIAWKIINTLKLTEFQTFAHLADEVNALDQDNINLEAMKDGETYKCAICGNEYSTVGWFRKHLEKKHHWKFHSVLSSSSAPDNPVHSFLFMSLLIRDTYDSYRMGDGNRIVRNAHFEWLFSSATGHSKYKIWLFRMMAYVKGLLLPKTGI